MIHLPGGILSPCGLTGWHNAMTAMTQPKEIVDNTDRSD
jgi:hypothetical protein